ncbi:acetyl/propionyl-CoA carboxylase alpha subunit [Streptomyces zagrosensis]|uniref:Acetyl/propionyl-CoA carboxylase alpha subunit n=2 Tax=Streptomyces zagrosensis TaxID=1042984 RepID=A0A7W9Q771_9ACTN|nr:acetyl/propionyl-CoA carboxylase alpha subunit [Streptomyces zagrosensis]
MATAIPFHRAVVADRAFAPERHGCGEPFTVHTRWIETEFVNEIPAFVPTDTGLDEDGESQGRETVVVEVGGKRLEVSLPASLGVATSPAATGAKKPKRKAAKKSGSAASGDALTSPMQGTIVKVAVEEGQQVEEGELIVVLEAMKMEQPLNAHRAGTIKDLTAEVGGSVSAGAVICEIKD